MKARPRRRVRFVPTLARSRGATHPARVAAIIAILERLHASATTALHHDTPFQLLAATILSAQCTDARVNMVTPALFARYPTAARLAQADPADVESIVHSTGFFRSKAKNLIGMAMALCERHGGEVPTDLDALTALPGVGRKTANVLRGTLFSQPAIIVDTHCSRLARRLGWTRHEDPVRIERDLMDVLPRDKWTVTSHSLVLHGRETCTSRKPRCGQCELAPLCPSAEAASET